MEVIVDTGPLYALRDEADQFHRTCVDAIGRIGARLVVPCSTLSEISYHVEKNLSSPDINPLLRDIESGALRLEHITVEDYSRIRGLVSEYEDLKIGFVDASIVAIAERLGIDTIFTLDRRHFSVVRPRHIPEFKLVPDVAQ